MPDYPIFVVRGRIINIRENGFVANTQYGDFNILVYQETSIFSSQSDAVPTKGQTGLHLLKKGDIISLELEGPINDQKTITASSIRVIN